MTTTPGRVVDIVHAAALATGHEVYSIDVQIGHRRYAAGPEVSLYLVARPTLTEALGVFAALGVPASEVTFQVTSDHHHAVAEAGILDGYDLRIITQPVPDIPEPSDPTALIAAVDAARAASD